MLDREGRGQKWAESKTAPDPKSDIYPLIDLYPVIDENTLASHPVTASFIFYKYF